MRREPCHATDGPNEIDSDGSRAFGLRNLAVYPM